MYFFAIDCNCRFLAQTIVHATVICRNPQKSENILLYHWTENVIVQPPAICRNLETNISILYLLVTNML
jgi:hypothetical protein